MKEFELSINDMIKKVKKNYKISLIIFGICVLVGIICGLISAYNYKPKENVDITQIEETIELENIEKNGEYYYNAFLELKKKNEYLKAYLSYFEQVNISNESRIKLEEIEKDIDDYQQNYELAENFYKENAPVIFSEKENTVDFYKKEINLFESEKIEYDKELEELLSNNYAESYKTAKQEEILKAISKLNIDIEMFNNHIDIINNSTQEEIEKTSKIADEVLIENINILNNIIQNFNDTLKIISKKDNYEIIYNKRLINGYFEEVGFNSELDQEKILENSKGRAIIYARSIAGLDIKSERFLATCTFFILFGIVLALVIGIVLNLDKRK